MTSKLLLVSSSIICLVSGSLGYRLGMTRARKYASMVSVKTSESAHEINEWYFPCTEIVLKIVHKTMEDAKFCTELNEMIRNLIEKHSSVVEHTCELKSAGVGQKDE